MNDPNSAAPLASPASTTIYVLTVTDGNGCSDTDDMTVTVNSDPPLDAGADQSICAGQQVLLGGAPTSVPGSSYAWTPSTGLDDATLANPTATPGATTLYTLTVTNDTCTSSQQVLVTLQGIAEPAFSVRLGAELRWSSRLLHRPEQRCFRMVLGLWRWHHEHRAIPPT
ncbi:MAG: hypothetical protein IPN85_18685 [Flavobacteriales bacterium]|nr:hypothetical protein [Flavobacteriales bacterium]